MSTCTQAYVPFNIAMPLNLLVAIAVTPLPAHAEGPNPKVDAQLSYEADSTNVCDL